MHIEARELVRMRDYLSLLVSDHTGQPYDRVGGCMEGKGAVVARLHARRIGLHARGTGPHAHRMGPHARRMGLQTRFAPNLPHTPRAHHSNLRRSSASCRATSG